MSVYLHELLALYIALNAMMFTLIGRAASGRQNERIVTLSRYLRANSVRISNGRGVGRYKYKNSFLYIRPVVFIDFSDAVSRTPDKVSHLP